jgi:hypothetical protein
MMSLINSTVLTAVIETTDFTSIYLVNLSITTKNMCESNSLCVRSRWVVIKAFFFVVDSTISFQKSTTSL